MLLHVRAANFLNTPRTTEFLLKSGSKKAFYGNKVL